MRLAFQTWREVETYLARSAGIIVPIGSTEQHGPTGLIGTDAICAEEVACRVGTIADALVAPTIAVGIAGHHMAFAGTMSHTPSLLIAVLREQVTALASHGFRQFFFVNGHGGNIATIQAAFAEIHALRWQTALPPVRFRLANWWDVPAVGALSRRFYGDADGSHATASEIAITRFALPDYAKKAVLEPQVAPSGGFQDAADFRRRFPDGRIGSDPGLSTAEQGGELLAAAADGLAETYRAFLAED